MNILFGVVVMFVALFSTHKEQKGRKDVPIAAPPVQEAPAGKSDSEGIRHEEGL